MEELRSVVRRIRALLRFREAAVVLRRLPLRLRWSLRLRGGKPCVYVVARFGLRVASTVPAFFVDVDGRKFGRHLNPVIWTSRGVVDGEAPGPLYGRLAPGPHHICIYDGTGERWATEFSLAERESLVVFVRARQQEKLWKDSLTIQCLVSDRAGTVLRRVA